MQKNLCLLFMPLIFMLFPFKAGAQVDDAPVAGVSDRRTEIYVLKNARVFIDYQTTLEKADILISKGRIEAVGQDLPIPYGAILYDLAGKTVYPSFIDAYAANYGIKSQASSQSDANPYAALMVVMQGGRGGSQAAAPEARPGDYWNDGINASYDVSKEFIPETRTAGEYRQAGFGAVVTFKADGIARGTSALVSTGDGKANSIIIKNKASANYTLLRGRSADIYPASQFGIIALMRQVNYDAQWYRQLPSGYFHDDGLEAYTASLSLPQVFEASNKLEVLRADRIGEEFGIDYIIKGGGDEYQALTDVKKTGNRLIVPVNFPEAPDVKDPFDAAAVSYATLKHYEMAPANLSRIAGAGITFAITSSDLRQRSSFLTNLRKAVKYGLSEADALKALTTTPAAMTGAGDLVGAVKKNMLANLLVTSGNIFSDDCVIYENWVQGVPYRFADYRLKDLRGTYSLKVDTIDYKLTLSGTIDKPAIKLVFDTTEVRGAAFSREQDIVTIIFDRASIKFRLPGYITTSGMEGKGQTDKGIWVKWTATFIDGKTVPARPKRPSPATEIGKVIYPFTAYGRESVPVQEDILFRNATVWTCEKDGNLANTDVLVQKGKIARIGKNISAPSGARVIDATGMHLTPGIIDEHSHIAADGGANEMGQAITSEVRISDIINPEDISLYRQLAGGVTMSHILHGSANPIGGQSALIKERWGHNAAELMVENQPLFLKHALGENVKRQANRYPNTRMGTEQIIRDAYQRAVDYRTEWKAWNALKPAERAGKIPPRRDLELDAIADVLDKKRYIECHTYVQSEGAMILNLASEFGVRVNALIHFNEGYKIADQIREHGAAASVFSDWWDYKYEVYEGIAYNAAMLIQQGVLTCLHSDDAEMGRRLNQEAAKIMKYGGIPETEALKLVTLNPAKMLHMDERTGSIKVGKDADLALWNGYPLSVYAKVSKTIVDGTIYFDEEQDARMRELMENERTRIIGNILREPSAAVAGTTSNFTRR